MRGRFLITKEWGRGAAIAAALMILATSLCLFDRDGDGTGDPGLDLCMVLLADLALVLLVAPTARRWSVTLPYRAIPAVLPHLPDPPPKSALFV